jgi:hypothetical protein
LQPDILAQTHSDVALTQFGKKHIENWLDHGRPFSLRLEPIWGLPTLDIEVYEFNAKTDELLVQRQWFYNEKTRKNQCIEKVCPPLGMLHLNQNEVRKYDQYVQMLVDNHMNRFAQKCYASNLDDFMERLLLLLVKYEPDKPDEVSIQLVLLSDSTNSNIQSALLKDVYKLLVLGYIMNHIATIPQEDYDILYQLEYKPPIQYGKSISPRMANRQLKYLIYAIYRDTMEGVLRRLQQTLRSSKVGTKWMSAFCCLLALAMVFEDNQEIVQLLCDNEARMGVCTPQDAAYRADRACVAIDDNFNLIKSLFVVKYNKGFNPLQHLHDPKVQKDLGDSASDFARSVSALVKEKCKTSPFSRPVEAGS